MRSTTGTLHDRTALVTGASGGIGAIIAKDLTAAGATVIVGYGSKCPRADDDDAGMVSRGVAALAAQADIADTEAITALLAEVDQRCGKLDVLVNHARVFEAKPLASFAAGQFDHLFRINVLDVLLGTHGF